VRSGTGGDHLLLRFVRVVGVLERESLVLDELLLQGGLLGLLELGVVDVVERTLLAAHGQDDVVPLALDLDLDLARGGLLDGGLGQLRRRRLAATGPSRCWSLGWCGLGGLGVGALGSGTGRRLGSRVLLSARPRGSGTGRLRGGLSLTRSSSHSDPLGRSDRLWARNDPCQSRDVALH